MPLVGNLDDYLEMIKLQSLWIHFYVLERGTGYFVSFNNSIDLVHFRLTYRFAKVNTIRK